MKHQNRLRIWWEELCEECTMPSFPTLFALAVTVGMAAFDYSTLYAMFAEDWGMSSSWVYALVLAAALEGLPYLMGKLNSERVDTARYIRHDKKRTRSGLGWAFFGFVVTYGVVVYLRIRNIIEMQELNQFGGRGGLYEELKQHFLTVTPLITSIFAYVASWWASRDGYMDRLTKLVEKKHRKYLRCKMAYHQNYELYQQSRISLWTSLVEPDSVEMPGTSKRFRTEALSRIHGKLVANCVTCYPSMIERYNVEVEAVLTDCLARMADCSTTPEAIHRVPLADILREYDREAGDYADCWNYNLAGPDLLAELRSTLDNAVVVAQFETIASQKK